MISNLFPELRAPSKKGSRLLWTLMLLVSLFAVGCGDSNDEYVFTGTNNPAATGNVTFQFVRAQQAAAVPSATTRLRFEFFDAQGVAFANPRTVDFSATVTITDVPVSATSAVVTALDAAGNSLGSVRFTFTVQVGQTVVAVPSSQPVTPTLSTLTITPVSASLNVGQTLQLTSDARLSDGTRAQGGTLQFRSQSPAVANVSADGLVTALSEGTATVLASYSFGNVTRTAQATIAVGDDVPSGVVGTLSVSPSSVILNTSATQNVTVRYAPANVSSSVEVTSAVSGDSSNTTVATYVNGVVTAGEVPGNTTITLTYLGAGDTANATTTLAVQVVEPAPERFQLSRSTLDVSTVYVDPFASSFPQPRTRGGFVASFDGRNVSNNVTVTFASFSNPAVDSDNFSGYSLNQGANSLYRIFANDPSGQNPAPQGTTAIATVTYEEDGETYSGTIELTVEDEPSLENVETLGVKDGSVVVPEDEDYTLAVRFLETYSDGSQREVQNLDDDDTFPGFESYYTYTSADPGVADIGDTAGGANLIAVRPGTTGTTTITVSRDQEFVTTFDVTVVDQDVQSLAVNPTALTVNQNQYRTYSLIATLAGGQTQDVTYAVRQSPGDPNGSLIVTPQGGVSESRPGRVSATADGSITFSLSETLEAVLTIDYVGPEIID